MSLQEKAKEHWLYNSCSGPVKIIGPCAGWKDHERYPGDLIGVNWGAKLIKPNIHVSKETEMFQNYDAGCLKITGDTWTIKGVEQIQIPSTWFSGVYALRIAKYLGYDEVRIFGIPADYMVPPEAGLSCVGRHSDESQKTGWEQHRDYFDNVTVFGGNLPKWFPELKD